MPAPFILKDPGGDNYVDDISRKIDEHSAIYYELKGRNNSHQQRLLRIYDKNLVKAYLEKDGVLIDAMSLGVVQADPTS